MSWDMDHHRELYIFYTGPGTDEDPWQRLLLVLNHEMQSVLLYVI